MNERELGKRLLGLDTSKAAEPDAQHEAGLAVERQQRRVWRLAVLAVFLWLLAVSGIALLVVVYFWYLAPRLESYARVPEQAHVDSAAWLLIGRLTAAVVLGSVVTVLLAAICTVLLVLASRSATLRQLDSSLAGLAEELKRLRQDRGEEC